jgi:hypothetical protein
MEVDVDPELVDKGQWCASRRRAGCERGRNDASQDEPKLYKAAE